jgi:hypothetical protein
MGYFDDFAAQMNGQPVGAPLDQIIQNTGGNIPNGVVAPIRPDPQTEFQNKILGSAGPQAPPADFTAPSPLPRGAPLSQRLAHNIGSDLDRFPGAPMDQFIAKMGMTPPASPRAAAPAPPQTAAGKLERAAPGGGAFNSDVSKTAKDLQRARGEVISGMRREETDTQALTQAQVERTNQVADLQAIEAKRQLDAADDSRVAESHYQQNLSDFNAKSLQLADDIRQQKVDPNRLYGNADAGTRVSLLIGGALGGMMAGLNGGENQFLKMVQGQIDRDVAAQESNYNRQKDYLSQRNSIYGQMRQQYGDARLANQAYRQAQLEGYKTQIEATTARLGTPEMQAKGQILVDQLDNHLQDVNAGFAKEANVEAQKRAAAAASANAAERARKERAAQQLFENQLKVAGLAQEQQKIDQTGKEKVGKLTEEEKVQKELEGQLKTFAAADPKELSSGTRGGAFVAEHLPSFSDDARLTANKREAYNTKLLVGAGAAYRWGSGGMEPKNEAIISEMIRPYKILPSDNETVAKEKIAAFREYLIQEAAGKGAAPAAAPASFVADRK